MTQAGHLLVISDLHLGPQTQERNSQFLHFLDQALRQGSEVLILGDLFELWFGWPHLTFEYQKKIVSRMAELHTAGLNMDYVEGNHDFWISNYCGKLFRTVSANELSRKWKTRSLYFEHGDQVNRKDWQYLAWRSLSKNAITHFSIKHIPPSVLLQLSRRLEAGMKSTNLRNKLNYPDEQCKKFYRKHFHEGHDTIVIGHFHQKKEIVVQVENKTMLFYNLPGWESGFEFLVIPASGERPFFQHLSEWRE